MKSVFFKALFLFFLIATQNVQAQRLADHNTLGWIASFNTIQLNKKFSLWLEYQWRRDHVITDWQQSLLRSGIQYQFNNGVSVMAGYGYIITYPYGDFPAGTYTVPEHRIFEQLSWNDNIGRLGLNHRVRLEQRYLGKIDQKAASYKLDDWVYLNRVRYQLRATYPLNKPQMRKGTVYMAAYDELFIGFGKNVNQNVFDQNRIGLLAGYQFNKTFRAEGGWFNQTVQQSGEIGNREVYQYNNGVVLNLYTQLFN